MDVSVAVAVILVVVLVPILFLASLGLTQLMGMLTYNPPLLPKGSPGEVQKGLIIKGEALNYYLVWTAMRSFEAR